MTHWFVYRQCRAHLQVLLLRQPRLAHALADGREAEQCLIDIKQDCLRLRQLWHGSDVTRSQQAAAQRSVPAAMLAEEAPAAAWQR